LGPARPTPNYWLTTAANAMRLLSKSFLLTADDLLLTLASAAFMRMLRRQAVARVPDFAGQRVREASIVVEVVDGTPSRLVHCTFSVLEFDVDGMLDVGRLNAQQFARVEDWFDRPDPVADASSPIVDAANRFIARGGSWEPDERLMRRIEAAALGRLSCPRVRVVR
jgi:hypothetical protein